MILLKFNKRLDTRIEYSYIQLSTIPSYVRRFILFDASFPRIFSMILVVLFLFTSVLATQDATFELEELDELTCPFQNNLPYPGFELQNREYLFLNKEWKYKLFRVDHKLSLIQRDQDGIKELEKESKGCYQYGFNDSSWKKVLLPKVNNPYPSRYQDGTWYRTSFQADPLWKKKMIKLFFQGANYITDVWINGHWIGVHEGGHTGFVFNISKYIKYDKKNILAVRIDNIPWLRDNDHDLTSNDKNIVPYKKCDWWNYGGLYRDVYLEISDPIYIVRADIQMDPFLNKDAQGNIKIYLHNSTSKAVQCETSISVYKTLINNENIISPKAYDITDLKSKVQIKSSSLSKAVSIDAHKVEDLIYSLELKHIDFWTPDNPVLYVLEVLLKKNRKTVDRYYTQFGVRKIEIAENAEGFTLNKKKIFFNGIARHEDSIDKHKAVSFDDAQKILDDLILIKDMNANFLRTSHYPNHPITYILTDRLGLAVMEEIPVFWFSGPQFDLQRKQRGIARQMWLEMIYRDYNRASILFWSTCNECGWQDERREFIWDLKSIAYEIDGSRMVGQSSTGNDSKDPSHRDCDYFGATMYYGVFYGKDAYKGTKESVARTTSYFPEKPFIATEYGIWSYDSFLNVEEQVEVGTNTYKALKENPQVGGVGWWCAFDWYTMLGYPYQSMGTISMDRKYFKPIYFTLQKLYARSPDRVFSSQIIGLKDKEKVKGMINATLKLKGLENQIKNVYFKFYPKAFKSLGRSNPYSISYNTSLLPEGKNHLIFKVKLKNQDCYYIKRDIIVDNRDDPPELISNLSDNKSFMNEIFLSLNITDDRGITSVSYQIDQKKETAIKAKAEGTYITTIDIKKIPDRTRHKLTLFIKDTGGQKIIKSFPFNVDRTPGIKVDLLYNLDRISYNHNRKDAFEWSLPAEELPDSNSWFITPGEKNVKFFLGPKDDKINNAMESLGQTLRVKQGQYKTVHFLGYTFWGNQDNNVILYYSDNSQETKSIRFSDWIGANPGIENETIGILASHYHSYEGDGNQKVALYVQTIKCDPEKELIKIKMPYDNHKHIFAISLEEVK